MSDTQVGISSGSIHQVRDEVKIKVLTRSVSGMAEGVEDLAKTATLIGCHKVQSELLEIEIKLRGLLGKIKNGDIY